jgi:hypothetical protein
MVVVMAYFEVLSWQLPAEAHENYEKPQQKHPVT